MKNLILLAVFVALAIGCASESEPRDGARPRTTAKTEQRVVLFEIGTTAKAAFLDRVSQATSLTDDEKKMVKDDISVDVYSHCRLVKYQRGGDLFMDVEQFYPRRETGRDSGGHTTVEGGSGSKSRYEYKNGQWTMLGSMNYD